MLRHVVMFTWNDDVDAEHVAAVSAGLDKLVATIEEIRDYRHGPDVGMSDQNFDYVLVGDFDSVEDYAAYRDHPDHQAFISELIAGHIAQRAAAQYEISSTGDGG